MGFAGGQTKHPRMIAVEFSGHKRAVSGFPYAVQNGLHFVSRRFISMDRPAIKHGSRMRHVIALHDEMWVHDDQKVFHADGVRHLKGMNSVFPPQDRASHSAFCKPCGNSIQRGSAFLDNGNYSLRFSPCSLLDANVAFAVKESCDIGYVHTWECTTSYLVAAKQLGRRAIAACLEMFPVVSE